MSATPPKTEQELKDYCFKARADEKPVDEKWPLGQVRCVASLQGGSSWYWTGCHWCQNSCYAKRYAKPSSAKMVATKKGGIVVRFHNDRAGGHPLRYA